jgi:cytochrome c peroxidase
VTGTLWLLVAAAATADDAVLRRDALARFGVLEVVSEAATLQPSVKLGQALFWDERLSANGQTACASCHLAEDWGADRRHFSPDARGRNTARNSQTVFNATRQPALRWTGDRTSAAHQAERSLTGSMGFDSPEAVVPLLRRLGYEADFQAAFPQEAEPVSPGNYGKAIQAYEETLITPAPFDRYLAGDDDALSAPQKEGLKLFSQVGCADCHRGPLLGGRGLRKFGVEKDYWIATRSEGRDAGLFESTQVESDRYRFRVSMLRNVARTGPYFHDGSVSDLEEAVQVMADVQLGDRLPEAQARAIVTFLESLTGEVPPHYRPPAAKVGAAAQSHALPPIDCPLRSKGIDPSHLRPFAEVEQYIRFLERPDRAEWQRPDAVIAALGLTGRETVVDLGAGSGYFSFRLARVLPRGRVVAADTEAEMVRHLHHKARTDGVANLQPVLIGPEDPEIPAEADLVLICDVLHHVKDRPRWLARVAAQMKPGARLVLIEFKEGELPQGPPESAKVPRTAMLEWGSAAGLVLATEKPDLLPYQTFLVFQRSAGPPGAP